MYSSWLPAISQRIQKNIRGELCLNVFISFSIIVCCLVVVWCSKSSIISQPKWEHKLPQGGTSPYPPSSVATALVGSIHLLLIFKFKFKFIDFEKTKFKFKFIDFAKVEFKFQFIHNSWADSNSKFKFNPTLVLTCFDSFELKTVYLSMILITLLMILKLKSKSRFLEYFHGKINLFKSTISYITAYLSWCKKILRIELGTI